MTPGFTFVLMPLHTCVLLEDVKVVGKTMKREPPSHLSRRRRMLQRHCLIHLHEHIHRCRVYEHIDYSWKLHDPHGTCLVHCGSRKLHNFSFYCRFYKGRLIPLIFSIQCTESSCSTIIRPIEESNQIKSNLFAINKVHTITVHKKLHFTWLDRGLRLPIKTKPGLSNLIVSRGRIIFQIVSAGRMS